MYKSQPTPQKTNRRVINVSQNSFAKGYISTIANSRRPIDSLTDMTNMELTQDNIPRPRPPLVSYGTQPTYTVIGRGSYRYNGVRGLLFMMVVGGVGKIYRQNDGGAFTLIGGANAYSATLWAGFRQSKNRVYVYNDDGTATGDNLSYINLATMATVEYTALSTPAAPTIAKTGLTAGVFNYYYKVTANNLVGESAASAASTAMNVNLPRDEWDATHYTTVSWVAVAGATSYTIYGGTGPEDTNQFEIITLSNLTTLSFVDNGSMTFNPFKNSPASNSTEGAIFTWMYVDSRNAQVYGITADNKLYYSAPGTGDFSPLNGGGYTIIDEGGDTQLNFVDGFRTGKGDPVITVSSRGASGKGKLSHVTFDTATYGSQTFLFPTVMEANGQSCTYAPRATVKSGDSLYYPTGDTFKATGTSQNIVNILTTSSIAQVIEPDVNKISLGNLYKAVGMEYQDKIYFSLPVGSTENNEIWYLDKSRKNAWILRWNVAAKDLWLYEDNSGTSHFCALVNNEILEFTRAGSQTTSDNGVAFSTRCAFSSLVWDKDGITLGNVNNMYFKLLQPKGEIQVNTYGLSKRGASTNTGSDTYTVAVSYTGYDIWNYDNSNLYDDDPGAINTFAKSVAVLDVRPKGLLNQIDWEILTEDSGCDYILSSVTTRGMSNNDLVYRGIG